jgi:ribosomal protein S18 acetylase RimI-like enzyme
MMTLTNRWYRDDGDLARMLALVTASALRDGPAAGHHHVGDVVWGLFPNPTVDPTDRIVLFEGGDGALRGFLWLRPPRGFEVHVDTTLPDVPGTVVAMIDWAEGHLDSLADAVRTDPFTTELASTAHARREIFAARGYRPTDDAPFQLNHQSLGDDLPAPALPPGASVRPVRFDDPADVEARVALHLEVWEPSKFSAPGYARLRQRPVYRPDLDLVAVTPSGELAAYCIVWWDPETRTAEFEPVGTATRFRRQGYGKALLRDALRRLRALGATDAIVVSETRPESEPARGLYGSVGFRRVLLFEQWERRAGDQS